jgi:tetratricopeptide (TPR) repeat protein
VNDLGPREALLLAVRAARRALAINPDDAGAFQLLGEAYYRLARQTRELGWQAALPELSGVRRVQVLTALEQAVLLRPDLDEAHALLAQIYAEGKQLDRALEHLRARLRIADGEAAGHGPSARAAADRQRAVRAAVDATEAQVHRSEAIYASNVEGLSGPSKVLERARLAQRHGLSQKALEMLLESSPVIFGRAGTLMQLDLMLQSGRAYEVRDAVKPEHEALLDFEPYHWLRLQADAACGDFAGADEELAALADALRRLPLSREQSVEVRDAIALRAGGAVLARPAPGSGAAGLAGVAYQQFGWVQPLALAGPVALLRRGADLDTVRGLLALESGDVGAARDHFASALRVWGDADRAAAGAGVEFPARPIAARELRLLDGGGDD